MSCHDFLCIDVQYHLVLSMHANQVASLIRRLSREGKESLVTTVCACAICGLFDYATVYTMPAKLESCGSTIKRSFQELKMNVCSSYLKIF